MMKTASCIFIFFWCSVAFRPMPAMDVADAVAHWQLDRMNMAPGIGPDYWSTATFWFGLSRFPKYFDHLEQMAKANKWQLGPRPYHADDAAIGQSYVALYEAGRGTLTPTLDRLNFILQNPPTDSLSFHDDCQRWCWADALFSEPPLWFAASRITGDPRYKRYADTQFWQVRDELYDRQIGLFYRDSRFKGTNVFWGRGNGWVFAGLANILRQLNAEDAKPYAELFRSMAKKLASLQRADGFWQTSLTEGTGVAESSATAFITYGLLEGINLNILDASLQRHATAGWDALTHATIDGKLGRVQRIGFAPDHVDQDHTEPFAAGAMLLAAAAKKEK